MIPRYAKQLCHRIQASQTVRLYATVSEALATKSVPVQHPNPEVTHSPLSEMQGFLHRRSSYTLIPPPLPSDRSSPINEFYFSSSPTHDLLSIMDACLHQFHDVSRAKQIFERLRQSKNSGEGVLDTRLYNHFLEAYIGLSSMAETANYASWVREAWALFSVMERGAESVHPNHGTYAIMLVALHRFSPESSKPLPEPPSHTYHTLLSGILDRGLKLSDVIAHRIFSTSEEASATIQALSKAAVELGKSGAVEELGMATALGSTGEDPLEDVPEVTPVLVENKTQGEDETSPSYSTPFNLALLRKHLAAVHLARRALPQDAVARQKLLEESVWDVAQERMRQQSEVFAQLGIDNGALKSDVLQAWMWSWHVKLTERLEGEIRNIVRVEKKWKASDEIKQYSRGFVSLGPFLSLLKPEKLSLIAILETMHLHNSGGIREGMKTARALIQIGKAVEVEYKAEMCRKNNIQIPTSGTEHNYFSHLGYRDLRARRVAARKYMEDSEEWASVWTPHLRAKVGSILVDALMNSATVERTGTIKRTGEKVTETQPAFYHSYEYVRGQKLGVLKMNPVVVERLSKDRIREAMHPRHLPMLVPPKPWLDFQQGGYLYNKTYVMRFKDSQEQLAYLKHASELGHLELLYAGLDALGGTPWKINRNVFDVVISVWNSGERLGKIPPAMYDVSEPERLPSEQEGDIKAKSVYVLKQKAWLQAKANNHSERCSVNYKIEIARAFLGDTLYQPHNIDFRGRAYPIPPHLNHIGDDLSRGLLKFAEKKPLGERGLRWLKIHLSNLYGFDKANFDERVEFVMRHVDDIYDSAENPLEGRRWWAQADDPWQCLATCMELRAALEHPNPPEFESDLPVHQDGTCNGLQHYAALGGDDQGARQVNLDVTERPSDVYTYVATMVEELLDKEANDGVDLAIRLRGKVSRKVVKQTVMTTVYGVTYVGARAQIEKQLKDKGELSEEECWEASAYVAKKVLSCITNLFSGAKAIQNWLNLCARLISKSIPPDRLSQALETIPPSKRQGAQLRLRKEQMTSVIWTTGMGLPVVQPYRKTKKKQISTALQSVYISDPYSQAEVNTMKQASAFPPNFIHSLDATHMMLTALECRTQGLTFASVHDSYWTHACSIDGMSRVIRETFIALHSSDVLGRLHSEFQERYRNFKVSLASLKGNALLTKLQAAGLQLDEETTKLLSQNSDANEIGEDEEGKEGNVVVEPDNDQGGQEVASTTADKKNKSQRAKTKPKVVRSEDDISEAEVNIAAKFINVVKLLPPVPKKGSFNVKTIKQSQYFFS